MIIEYHFLPAMPITVYHLYPFVCLLVCRQDDPKTTEVISVTPGWRTGLSPEKITLTFGAHPSQFVQLPSQERLQLVKKNQVYLAGWHL